MKSSFVKPDYAVVAKGAIKVDLARCRQCFECEEICPTGVLIIPLTGYEFGKNVGSVPGVCIICRYCLTSCPDKALSLIPMTAGES
jgi:ferredoxin